ncbi:heavy metal-binding domain-containing protein [Tumidithrix elongata RA019]|uniref:Heavy metal-binding domain-containing protein n=1 Tax=Tumidithrix elongata BACA0141 TaxID=2716417 RepID=A0AAW9PZ19_9CYAN|nr:heavy metal-binding domain-containing protein [Tumidithrix elongata RA019]
MAIITGLSGNEIFCLRQKNLTPGDLVIGNSVISLGVIGSIASGLKTLFGGEVSQITRIIHEGRQRAYTRLLAEAKRHGGIGITGVSNELVLHSGNVEFLAIGSCVHQEGAKTEHLEFSTSSDGQALYCQMDAGFTPKQFVFGNVAYSIGVGGGLLGGLRSLKRGEVKEYSRVFNETRHLALQRIKTEARQVEANAVLGINTSILPFAGLQEMVMIGTASEHPALPKSFYQNPITSDLTNEEMWNLVNQGYMPVQLVLGVSVYSLGFVGGVTSFFKSFVRGEIRELTTLIYEAREEALKYIAEDARRCHADEVVGIKTYVYNLGGGTIEFLAIGTAVKKMPEVKTQSETLLPQAIIRDRDTFINTADGSTVAALNQANNLSGSIALFASFAFFAIYLIFLFFRFILHR